MSHNQSKSDKKEPVKYKKTARWSNYGQQRGTSGYGGSVKGDNSRNINNGQSVPAPGSSLASSGSIKKGANNTQGAQTMARGSSLNSVSSINASRMLPTVQNGSHPQPLKHGLTDALAAGTAVEVNTSGTRSDPKTPPDISISQSDKMAPTTHAKVALGDGEFSFQFGSISPVLVNGMQIPARTTSAPPNIEEQKNDEVCCNKVSIAAPPLPIPPIPKQQVPKKVATAFDQSSSGQAQPIPKSKAEIQLSSVPTPIQTSKPSVLPPKTAVTMEMAINQSQPNSQKPHQQASVQFGGPKPNLQNHKAQTSFGGDIPNSQIPPTGINMSAPMQLPNASYPQQMFVGPKSNSQIHVAQTSSQFVVPKPNSQFQPTGINMSTIPLQSASHLMQPLCFPSHQHFPFLHPGIMSQGQNMEFTTQVGPGSSNNSQYPVPIAPRRVKITDPRTNQELKFDGRADSFVGSHSNLPQPLGIPAFSPGQQINYPNNANHFNIFSTCSLPSASTPVAPSSQPQRFNYPGSQASYTNPYSLNPLPNIKPVNPVHGILGSSFPSHSVSVTVKPAPVSSSGKLASSSPSIISAAVKKDDICKHSKENVEDGLSDHLRDYDNRSESSFPLKEADHKPVAPKLLPLTSETVQTSISIPSFNSTSAPLSLPEKSAANNAKNIGYCQEPVEESHLLIKPQVGCLPDAASIVPSPALDDSVSITKGFAEFVEGKTAPASIKSSETVLGSGKSLVSESASIIDKTKLNIESSEVSGSENNYVPVQTVLHVKQADVALLHDCPVSVTARTGEENENQLLPEPKDGNGDVHSSDSLSSKSLNISQQMRRDPVFDTTLISNKVNSLEYVQAKLEDPLACQKDRDSPTVLAASSAETLKPEVENGYALLLVSGSDDNSSSELSCSQSLIDRAIKDNGEIFPTEKAARTSSDLFMQASEKHKGTVSTLEGVKVGSTSKQVSADVALIETDRVGLHDRDDFENTADKSGLIENASIKSEHINGVMNLNENGHSVMGRKYSCDFLLRFEHQCTALPDNFNVKSDLKGFFVASDIESVANSGRNFERSSFPSLRGAYSSVRDVRQDTDYLGNVNARSVQGNHGNSKNQRPPISMPYFCGGYIPTQSAGSHAGSHADRWQQRATGIQKGFNITTQTPLLVMHKAEKKYEVGKVTGEEEAKQRQLKAILNKLTPQNFAKLFDQVKTLNIDNAVTLAGIISQIFDKALMEPTFCEMYAEFCSHLAKELSDIYEKDDKFSFKVLLLNKCQEEFERGEREQEEANDVEEGEIEQTKAQREEKRMKARRRMLGNIRLIGELYKKRMLTDRIMHICINKLLGQQNQDPDEEDIEALCKLMSTIGELFDTVKCKGHMDSYFQSMHTMSNNKKLSSRVRFMLKDSIDLRKNSWQQRRKIDGPKKIEEVHRDAAQERQVQVNRLSRGPSFNPSAGRPMDFGSRGSNNTASNSRLGAHRGLPRGFAPPDSRSDSSRHSLEIKPLPFMISQKPNDNGLIALVPQGGLARGMSSRGQSSNLNTLTDPSPSSSDPRRVPSGQNMHRNIQVQGVSEDDDGPKCLPLLPEGNSQKRLDVQQCSDIRDATHPDHSSGDGRSLSSSPTSHLSGSVEWPEVHLQEKSIAAIREYYSARDEKELGLCIKDLKSPSFYPTMISIWVTDSFEQKDMERDLLAKLLVNLSKPQDGMLNHPHLIQGFETVLSSLEDVVMNDAPRAAEFLGHIFAKIILENVVSLTDVGRLVCGGGGNLKEAGLAGEVIGTILESIQREKGDEELNEIRRASKIRLEDFTPQNSTRSKKLQLFI